MTTASPLPFYTIGHSTLDADSFIVLLKSEDIECIVDVRRIPCSRKFPHFNQDALAQLLSESGIQYRLFPDLGGRRSRQAGVPAQTNAFWENASFHNYADYALQDSFQNALQELCDLGTARRCAIMCAESVWWRCHRRIITDYLLARGKTVKHIMSGRTQEAQLNPGAVIQANGNVVYPSSKNQEGPSR